MSQKEFEAVLRQSAQYKDAVELIEAIESSKRHLAMLKACLDDLGDAGSLARVDALQANLIEQGELQLKLKTTV